MYKVIIRNRRLPGLILEWDMAGESEFKTLKGATSRRVVAAHIHRAYDTAILTPGGFLLQVTDALAPEYATPAGIKKRKLVPRNPDYAKE